MTEQTRSTLWILLIWQMTYVNLEWEEFEKKHGEELLPEVLQYLSDNREHKETFGKAFRSQETVKCV